MAESDDGGLFAVSLTALASRRANPPPLIGELGGLINLTSAQQLAAALDAAAHPSLQQPLEAVAEHGRLAVETRAERQRVLARRAVRAGRAIRPVRPIRREAGARAGAESAVRRRACGAVAA